MNWPPSQPYIDTPPNGYSEDIAMRRESGELSGLNLQIVKTRSVRQTTNTAAACNDSFGVRLARIRKERGFTQVELTEKPAGEAGQCFTFLLSVV